LLLPFLALKATTLLIDFARSWSIDGIHLMLLTLLNDSKTKAGKPVSAGQDVLPAAGKLFLT
jgi:hypothetical protein